MILKYYFLIFNFGQRNRLAIRFIYNVGDVLTYRQVGKNVLYDCDIFSLSYNFY